MLILEGNITLSVCFCFLFFFFLRVQRSRHVDRVNVFVKITILPGVQFVRVPASVCENVFVHAEGRSSCTFGWKYVNAPDNVCTSPLPPF